MQCGLKGMDTISTIGLTKKTIKKEPVGVFQFCFQIWEAHRQLVNILFGFCSAVSKNCGKHSPNA